MELQDFSRRLSDLREGMNISARDMSLSIGQNPGYINNIETGKATPSLSGFLYICDFLKITPSEFFDFNNTNPNKLNNLFSVAKSLSNDELDHLTAIAKDISKHYTK